ncbi:hypothetical protein [Lentzea pudingi]|nr:hypothetical protein [Lentzea pudingi]
MARVPHEGVYEDVFVPLVDGTPLTDWFEAFSGVRQEDLEAKPFQPGKARLVLGCDCGIAACGPLVADITADGDTIVWSGFRRPHRGGREYPGVGPFVFGRAQYDEVLLELG